MSYTLAFLMICFLSGCITQSPQLTLDFDNTTNTCITEKIDRLGFIGSIDIAGINMSEWKDFISLDYKEPAGLFWLSLCTVDIKNIVCGLENLPCYCSQQKGNVYTFMLRPIAATFMNENLVRLAWSKDGISSTAVNPIQRTIPHIYDEVIQNASLSDNTTGITKLNVSACNIQATETTQVFQYCVYNLQLHSLNITVGNTERISTSDCVDYTFNYGTSKLNDVFYISYTENGVCNRNHTYTCVINAKPSSSVDYTDTIIGVVVGVGSCLLIAGIVIAVLIFKKEKPKCSDSKIILVIVVTVAGSVVIVGIIIGLLFYCNVCKFKKANKQPKGLTLTETTPPTNETSARHIETKRPLPPLAHLPPHKISPDISGNNEKASNITDKTSNETPNDSQRKKKPRKKRARRNLENGGKNDEQ